QQARGYTGTLDVTGTSDRLRHEVLGAFQLRRRRNGDHDPARPRGPRRGQHARGVDGVSNSRRDRMPGAREVEGGHLVAIESKHWDAQAFEPLEGQADVEDDLWPGAEDGDSRGR